MSVYKVQLLAIIDQLAAEADKLHDDDPRRDKLVVAITKFD